MFRSSEKWHFDLVKFDLVTIFPFYQLRQKRGKILQKNSIFWIKDIQNVLFWDNDFTLDILEKESCN